MVGGEQLSQGFLIAFLGPIEERLDFSRFVSHGVWTSLRLPRDSGTGLILPLSDDGRNALPRSVRASVVLAEDEVEGSAAARGPVFGRPVESHAPNLYKGAIMSIPVVSESRPAALRVSALLQKVGAECIGTFALVFAGCGAIMIDAQTGVIGHPGVALAFGLVVMVMIYAIGHVSGAHFNPAVTVAFAAMGRFPWRQVAPYILAQCAAATLAALTLKVALGDVASLGGTAPSGSWEQAWVFEGVLTFLLMFVIAGVATDSRAVGQMAGLAVGSTVALCALFGGPVCGASMNPARSLGPALVSGELEALVIYLVAPVIGALLGGGAYSLIRCGHDPDPDATGCC